MKSATCLRLLLCVDMLLITTVSYAQNESDTIYSYSDELNQLLENKEDENTHCYDDDIIELHERFTHPLNINEADRNLLNQFSFLTDYQIENILAYLYMHGEMKSIYELQLVKDMDWQTIRYLTSFFVVKPVDASNYTFPTLKELLQKGRMTVLSRLDIPLYKAQGYEDKYKGMSFYHSLQYTYRYRDKLYMGLSAEKDRGETFFNLYNRKGYDSYSFYMLIKDRGWLKTLAIGDYKLCFGQGLVVSNNYLFGKSAYMTSLNRRGNYIRKHSSTDEQNYFRGVAASFELSKTISLSTFVSYRRMDGTIKEDKLTSIHTSGLHRTDKEVDDRNSFGMLFTGANINYSGNRWQVGATGIYYYFDHSYEPLMRKYNYYSLRGSSFYNVGIDYSYHFKRFSLVGEEAIGKRGMAMLNKLQYTIHQGYNLILFHRYYAHNYWAYFAHTLSESSEVQNENGWFVAIDAKLSPKFIGFVAIDLISFPWYRFRTSKPSKAVDCLSRCSYYPSKNMEISLYYRFKQKERDVSGTKGMDIQPTYQHSCRCRMMYWPMSTIKFAALVDYKLFQQKGFALNKGFQFTQSTTYCSQKGSFQATMQGSYFNTDGYDTKVYIAERSLLYNVYMPSFQGTGFHLSLRLQYKINEHWLFIIHGAYTKYHHQDCIGSGADKINRNDKTDIRVQLRWKLP